MKTNLLIVVVVCLSLGAVSEAAVIRVEKDGSGDFMKLQPAADAAANGDTILVGPGYYRDLDEDPCYGSEYVSIMNVMGLEKLTIIGSGPEETVVGPEVLHIEDTPLGIVAAGFCGTSNLVVKNLGFENLFIAVYGTFAPYNQPGLPTSLIVENCAFVDNWISIDGDANQIRIINCTNHEAIEYAKFFTSYFGAPIEHMVVDNLVSVISSSTGFHFSVSSHDSLEIKNSWMKGGRNAINAWGDYFSLSDCTIDCDYYGVGAIADFNSITDCKIIGSGTGISDAGMDGTILQVERTEFSEIQDRCFHFSSTGRGSFFHDCIFDQESGYIVEPNHYSVDNPNVVIHIDMTDNWWGTTDPDSIQALIYDRNDDPSSSYIIDWDPFKMEPVPVEKTSLGSFKSYYR